jgi:hypothetical protein
MFEDAMLEEIAELVFGHFAPHTLRYDFRYVRFGQRCNRFGNRFCKYGRSLEMRERP